MTKKEARLKLCPYKMSNVIDNIYCEVDNCMAWKWTETKSVYAGDKVVEESHNNFMLESVYKKEGVEGECSLMGGKNG